MRNYLIGSAMLLLLQSAWALDTGQSACYDNRRETPCPAVGQAFYGQDGNYSGIQTQYTDNGDGTVTDHVTGLMWSKAVDPRKISLPEAKRIARQMTLGGHKDWRVPTIKELYSLIDFRGKTGSSGRRQMSRVPSNAIPFINTDYFDFTYGNTASGERYIDAQWLSSTEYRHTTMNRKKTLFGVNFADGRIKGYPQGRKRFYARYVRGASYGNNRFQDNGSGTITDHSTGLMWAKQDSGKGMNWQQALAYAESSTHAGYSDWRLPNAKELQLIVDYDRAPDVTGSAAISPLFQTSPITNEAGQKDYPYYWSSTTHLDGPSPGCNAAYVAFGRALGRMHGRIMDVHGAGAQRSDPKIGSPMFRGPQGDAVRSNNYVRLVRSGDVLRKKAKQTNHPDRYPSRIRVNKQQASYSGMQRQPHRMSAPPRGGFVSRLDRNGDGKVSRHEFDGPPDRFDFHDTNRDGYISEAEAPKGPPPNGQRPPRRSW